MSAPQTAVRPAQAGVPIPGVLLRFLEQASIAYAGTRDADLVPHMHWVCGWASEPQPGHVAFFVTEPFRARLLQDVAACPRIALTIETIGSHETYQFKGDFAGSRPVTDADRAVFESCRDRFVSAVSAIEQRFAFPDAALTRYLGAPALTATLRVCEIFVQTPGPGAGRRLVPPEPR